MVKGRGPELVSMSWSSAAVRSDHLTFRFKPPFSFRMVGYRRSSAQYPHDYRVFYEALPDCGKIDVRCRCEANFASLGFCDNLLDLLGAISPSVRG